MIALLRGLLDSVGEDSAIIDVNGVGYLVFASARTLRALPPIGQDVRLHIETQVREDHIHLFAFHEENERDWFRLLLTVQGVGAKVALSILSALAPDNLANAIAAQDRTTLSQAQGVGPKLAGRLASELKDKVSAIALPGNALKTKMATGQQPTGINEDAVSALVNLGYKRADAFGAVARAAQRMGEGGNVEALIRAGLKELSA
ncbi:MAG: ruvA [Alphaproteobacteria bacterium]|jgi:Holliday junction DNA helicase RuvA|nr:ruvA [Alphaproteobacteria bacterium]